MSGFSTRIEGGTLDAGAAGAAFVAAAGGGVGAVATFIGVVRGSSAGGRAVEALFLDHHPRLTEASLEAIGATAMGRFDLERAEIVHRVGRVAAGEAVVFVAAAAAHRRSALEAVQFMIDRLKTDAMLWKREDGPDGSAWIEPLPSDHDARARWA